MRPVWLAVVKPPGGQGAPTGGTTYAALGGKRLPPHGGDGQEAKMCVAEHVLVVEDQPEIRSLLEEALSLEGYTVRTAEDGRVALEQLAGFQPCVILLDLMMPVLDGRGFLRAYRRQPNADAHVLTMTAGAERRSDMVGLGVHDHLAKPFDLDELFTLVAHHLPQHAAI